MTVWHRHPFVLAVSLTNKGLGFVLFEGPESPFDWGVRRLVTMDKNAVATQYIAKLIRRYQPEAVVLEDLDAARHRRCKRNQELSRALARMAEKEGAKVYLFSEGAIRECFAAAGATKDEIAALIAHRIPAFASRMPTVRRASTIIDVRRSLFDAAALGLTYYHSQLKSDTYTPAEHER